jgi:hypothetical protein
MFGVLPFAQTPFAAISSVSNASTFVVTDRIQETTTTTGTGTITLAGAVLGYQSFAAVGNANTTYYAIAHQTLNEWEIGVGTYTASSTTLSRTRIITGSSGPSGLVNFSAGTKNVYCVQPTASSSQPSGLLYQDDIGYTYQTSGASAQLFPQYAVISNGSAITIPSAIGTANIFQSTPSITLKSNTYYMFDANYVMYKTSLGSASTISVLFGGTATLYGVAYTGNFVGLGTNTNGTTYDTAPIHFAGNSASAVAVKSGMNALNSWSIRMQGTVRVNAGGTLTPQISFSAALGTNAFVAPGSHFKIAPLGSSASNADINIGWQ